MENDVMFARGGKTEVRFLMDDEMAKAFEALAFVLNKPRPALMEEVLEAYAKKEIHKSIITVRLLRGNPLLAEGSGESSAKGQPA